MPNFLINVTTKGAKTASSSIKRLSGSLMSLSKVAMVGAAGGAIALGVAMKKATSAAAEQELQEKKLTQALGKNADALIKQAGALQQSSRFGDEAIIQQQAYLASIGMSEQQIREMIPVTMDLAAATGMSLESAVKNTAKTLSGMTGELGESVGSLRGLTAEELKAGKGIELMAELFDGAAEGEVKTMAGAMDQAKNSIGDAAEALGELTLPLAKAGAAMAKGFAEKAEEAFDAFGKIDFGKTFANMQTNMGALSGMILDNFKLVFKALPDLFGFYINKVVPFAMKAFGVLWEGIKAVSAFLWEPIGIGIQIVIGKVKNFFIGMVRFAQDQFNTLADLANTFGADITPIKLSKFIDTEGLSMANSEMVQLLKEGSEDNLDTFGDFATAQAEIYKKYAEQVIVNNEEIETSESGKNDIIITGTDVVIKKKKELTDKELQGYAKASGSAEDAMKAVVKAESMEAVAGLIASIFKQVPFPLNAILAAGAGATASGLIDKGLASFAEGGDFVTSGPQMMMVGDNPGGQEQVSVTPLSSPNIAGPQGGGSVTVNVSGNVLSQDFVEGELAENIKEAVRRGTDFGIS